MVCNVKGERQFVGIGSHPPPRGFWGGAWPAGLVALLLRESPHQHWSLLKQYTCSGPKGTQRQGEQTKSLNRLSSDSPQAITPEDSGIPFLYRDPFAAQGL